MNFDLCEQSLLPFKHVMSLSTGVVQNRFPCNGLFTFPDTDSGTDSDSDSKPNGYRLYYAESVHIAQTLTRIPISAQGRNPSPSPQLSPSPAM